MWVIEPYLIPSTSPASAGTPPAIPAFPKAYRCLLAHYPARKLISAGVPRGHRATLYRGDQRDIWKPRRIVGPAENGVLLKHYRAILVRAQWRCGCYRAYAAAARNCRPVHLQDPGNLFDCLAVRAARSTKRWTSDQRHSALLQTRFRSWSA